MNLVVVESPAKAKTIKKYLGPDYEVLASYGHVRDLRPKEGAVEPDNDFAMHYELIERNEKHVNALAKAMRKADTLLLATDPDREGEAIAWHVAEVLAERHALEGKDVRRVVFYEITESAVREAVQHARSIAMDLVNAQQARRALDYLVGFNLSPLLWKKIQRGLSAGRVQSPALRLICEREEEISAFQKQEYWTLEADASASEQPFMARLTYLDGTKLEQFSIVDEATATGAAQRLTELAGGKLAVSEVERKQRRRNPAAPFTTSTLQQEAARKLGFTAQRTMRVAQQLYEGIETGDGTIGLITYMRTDSVNLANEAVHELREYIAAMFDSEDLPDKPREFKTRSRNAQEAHEGIRPTSIRRPPESLQAYLSDEQLKLYQLIWRRTLASQMQHALINTVSIDLVCPDDSSQIFRATGSTVAKPGFLKVYEEGLDDSKAPEEERKLPPMEKGDIVDLLGIRSEQHFTEPPPRYSEATLVRTLEEYGIGRPSTYAAIISTLQQREYVELENRRFRPTDVGVLVNGFLTEHFSKYVDYEFTAMLEDDLDAISRGEKEWVPLMQGFWTPFKSQVDEKDANVTRREAARTRELGIDPKTAKVVAVRMGRYGPFVQMGNAEDEEKPKFASLRAGQSMQDITLEEALALFNLPRDLGVSDRDEPMSVGIGRFGPYVKYGSKYVSLAKEDDPHTISRQRALELVAAKRKADAEREIQIFEDAGIKVLNGRYGPYVTDGKKNAKVPKERDPKALTLEEAQEILKAAPAAKGRRGGGRSGGSRSTSRAATRAN